MADKRKSKKDEQKVEKKKPSVKGNKKPAPKKTPAPLPDDGGETFAQRLFRELQESDRDREAGTEPPPPPPPQTEEAEKSDDDDGGILKNGLPMKGLYDFLDRMRGSLITTAILLIIGTIAGFFFSDHILSVINYPFMQSGHKLNIFTVTGGFMIRVKASFGAAVLVIFPYFIFRLWRVARPIVPKESRMFSRLSVLFSVMLFYSGVAFVYFFLMPAAVNILMNFIGGSMTSTIGADDYLDFTILFSFSMGVLFDTPIIMMILTYLGLVTPQKLSKYRRHAIVIIWIIAALITPTPDPLTQSLVAVPLMIFFELSIVGSRLVTSRKNKQIA